MKLRNWIVGAAALGALLVAGGVRADELDQTVKGRLAAVDPTSGGRGDFRLESRRHTNGGSRDVIVMNASRLGATKDANGNLPVYHAVLIDSSAVATDFGAVRLNKNGQAYFRFDSRFDTFPAGITSVTAFGGGKFELQHEGSAVLRGDVHAFVGLTDQASKLATAHYHGKSKLLATINGGAGKGTIEAHMQNDPNKVHQRLKIEIRNVGKLGNPFSVVALDVGGAEVVLGQITTHGRNGQGKLEIDTRRKNKVIPGGGIPALLGKSIEVRNTQGTVVLTGVFPSVPQ